MRADRREERREERFEALYVGHYPAIYAYVHRRLLGLGAEVTDVVADVFSVAWRRLDEVPDAPEDRLWLYGVARRCVARARRSGWRRRRLQARLSDHAQCEGPLPLPARPLVAVMGDPTVCKPHPAQLVWGLALTNVSVALRSGGGEQVATRRSIPAQLRARGNVFYAWARSAPDSLVARDANGKVAETYPINTASVPVFAALCKHQPASGHASTLPQIQTNQP